MSLLDQISNEQFRPESASHPAEGCIHDGAYIVIEDGECGAHRVHKYEGVTTEMLNKGVKLPDPEILIEADWEACLEIYDLQSDIDRAYRRGRRYARAKASKTVRAEYEHSVRLGIPAGSTHSMVLGGLARRLEQPS